MDKQKKFFINKWIGPILVAVYAVSAACLAIYCIRLNIFPVKYIVYAGVSLALLGVLAAILFRRPATFPIGALLMLVLTAACLTGFNYIQMTWQAIDKVTEADLPADIISVYVMQEDPAQTEEDIADYQIAAVSGASAGEAEYKNVKKTIEDLEKNIGGPLDIREYETGFAMLDDLREGKIQAVVLGDVYLSMAADVEGYGWASEGLRRVAAVEHQAEEENRIVIPKDVPETFIMYLSGIDTYGSAAARSRSDVNILAVVNIRTKKILLLSTPRDYYIEYEITGGAKDKLTHAGVYGVDASVDALQRLYDIQVDYYLKINFTGFVEVIDALGGVDVNSDYSFTVPGAGEFTAGQNHLTGEEALIFARERYSFQEGDYQRAKNQMEVVRAMIQKCASGSMLKNYRKVLKGIEGSIETNMPNEQLASLVKMQLADMAQWEVTSYTPGGTSMYAETFSMPGELLSVIEPDQAEVEEAKAKIQSIYTGGSTDM